MRSFFCALGLATVAMIACVGKSHADFDPIVGFDQQLFPSYLISTANIRISEDRLDARRLGDPTGVLGVEITAPEPGVPVVVTIECNEFMEPSQFSGTLDDSGATYRITPKIKYRYDRLARCDQAVPTNITFRVRVGDGVEEEQTLTCTVRSINDCPIAIRAGDSIIDTSFAFAAYVNEQHPFVDKLLREALDRGVVTSFQGYQTKDPDDVIRQAYALWDLLVARDIRYSSITTTAVDSSNVLCQHVRLIEDSINNSQANCVDGSVLWVSMLRKIGIDGFLVLTSDHCYAGFYLDPEGKHSLAIETTLVGVQVDSNNVEIPESLETAVPEELRYDDSFASFVAALVHGTQSLESNKKTSENKEAQASMLQIIDIATIRKDGVLPIAFQNRETFVSYDFSSSTDENDSDSEATDESGDASDDSESNWEDDEAE